MKIAIVTLIGLYNNGNRLQNYALQQTLKKIDNNIEVETLIPPRNESKLYSTIKAVAKFFLRPHNHAIKNFKKFNENINFNPKEFSAKKGDIAKITNDYDYFVTGSDQVWNLDFADDNYYFLDWVPTEKKLSYAASIGNNELTPYNQARIKNVLNPFEHISVREKQSEDMLKSLGINNVTTCIDPTLLLTAKEWDIVSKAPKKTPKSKSYVFVCLLGNLTDEYNEKIHFLAKTFNLQVINLKDRQTRKSGPSEFIYLIKNARFVVTDSFHCIVFAIIYNIPFFHFSRSDNNIINNKMTSRLENLERVFSTKFLTHKDITADNIENLESSIIKNKDEILKQEQEYAFNYLKNALKKKKPITLDDKKFKCTGCGLCANICPQKAIKIVKNEKGFYRYQIDPKKCNRCGACLKLCPMNKTLEKENFSCTQFYGAKNQTQTNDNSSSAGIFGKLATHILNQKGIVYGLSYGEKDTFSRITSVKDLESIKGSKYYQGNISTIYPMIEKDLNSPKAVLVCGTPCQIAGIKQKFGHNKSLIAISFVCHGTPSRDTLNTYLKETFDEDISFVNFRKKQPYWDRYNIEFSSKTKTYTEPANNNIWFKSFLKNYFLNDCCYNCHFAGNKFGADIILGDFWGIQNIDPKFYDKYGTSLVIVLSEKGHKLFSQISPQLITKIYNRKNSIINNNPCISHTHYEKQKEYIQELYFINQKQGLSFEENIKDLDKNCTIKKTPFIRRAIRKIKRVIFHK